MDLFQSFQRECPAPAALCGKYASALPPELLNVWQNYGFGTLLDGCLKIINPDEYQDLLRDTYALGDSAIPVFATAFAGLLTWEKGRYLRFVNYQSGAFEGVAAGLKFFWGDLADGVFNDRFLELARYREAVQALASGLFWNRNAQHSFLLAKDSSPAFFSSPTGARLTAMGWSMVHTQSSFHTAVRVCR